MQPSYDVAVAYRVYPGISRSPAVFADDKLRLVELCLRSFRDSLRGLRARVWLLLDGCPAEYEEVARSLLAAADLEIVRLDGVGNWTTFEMQVDLLLRQEASEVVYFAEDDYFYSPGGLREMVDFLRSQPDAHFVTPYDHADYYSGEVHRHPNAIRVAGGRHWRTANSTCLTFLTTRRTLERTQGIFRTYARGNHDLSLWLSLTKHVVRSPGMLLRLWARDRQIFRLAVKSWLYGAGEAALGRRWRLWAPIPSIATHLESTCLAPAVDWEERIRQAVAELPERPWMPAGAAAPLAPRPATLAREGEA